MTKLLVVESPNKARKISTFLPSDWIVRSTLGHFRILASDGSDNLGFDLENNRVAMRFVCEGKGKKVLKDLKQYASKADEIYVATDSDREGELIAWHVYQAISSKNKDMFRVAFEEITKEAVLNAIAKRGSLDENMVDSALARTCLDKLIGFKGSPIVRNIGARSIGRVQSSSLHLVCLRENEINNFNPEEYYSLLCVYQNGSKAFYAGHSTESGKDDKDSENIALESKRIFKESEAKKIVKVAEENQHIVEGVEKKSAFKKPAPPFTTSTLQQVASTKLNYSPKQTMKLAQAIYEKGLITYMRTDSVALSEKFCLQASDWLKTNNPEVLPEKANKFKSGGGAQEAHEAIRPTDINNSPLGNLEQISDDEMALYALIWNRAIASQCAPAKIDRTRVVINAGSYLWQIKGQVLAFAGYTEYWNNLSKDVSLPEFTQGQALNLVKTECDRKTTSPPPRYTEAQLIAALEKKGIGRPSTYASLTETIKQREYVKLIKKRLTPTEIGIKLDRFMADALPDLIDEKFTAKMELNLDAIAKGDKSWEEFLCGWNDSYFIPALEEARRLAPEGKSQKPSGTVTATDIKCPKCEGNMERYDYIKDGKNKSLLRCSVNRLKKDHKDVVFWRTKNGDWWNPKIDFVGSNSSNNKKPTGTKAKKSKKVSPIKLKNK